TLSEAFPSVALQKLFFLLQRLEWATPASPLSDHHRNRFVNRLSLIGDGGLADHEAAVHLTVQGGRAVVIKAGHQDGPSLIRKILGRLADGGHKGPKRREPFAIVEREQRKVIWQIQSHLTNGFQGTERHVLGYRKDG